MKEHPQTTLRYLLIKLEGGCLECGDLNYSNLVKATGVHSNTLRKFLRDRKPLRNKATIDALSMYVWNLLNKLNVVDPLENGEVASEAFYISSEPEEV